MAERKTLRSIFEGKTFEIPDYQRGYAWGKKQLNDFVQDIDALIDEEVKSHYTGTIVSFQKTNKPTDYYGVNKLEVVDIVDGQQRLTTCSLFLSVILSELIKHGIEDYKDQIAIYLYSGSKSKLKLNNDTSDCFYDLISKGSATVKAGNVHQDRVLSAYKYLSTHIKKQLENKGNNAINYLRELFDAITRKLHFSYYTIEDESEIGMTFELMNSRGKALSSLELLKNYLMHWAYRNASEGSDRQELTDTINKSWKAVYTNIASCGGDEDQCLRIAWILLCNHSPKTWKGYTGFKADQIIPLRDFKEKSKEDTKEFILTFAKGIAEISTHYAVIVNPLKNSENREELEWLGKITNAGNIANYLPLLVSVRKKVIEGEISQGEFISCMKTIELFSYRVFMWSGKRSNAGKSQFYRWADDIYANKHNIETVIKWMTGAINWYSNEKSFRKGIQEEFYSWYYSSRLLKYTLYEYELYLLNKEGKGASPKLKWKDLADSTLEHILPQTPSEDSEWTKKWSKADMDLYLHDISNIVLTKHNSHYLNFDFERKKGAPGVANCYANSDIRQERKIATFDDWTAESCQDRRETLVSWIVERWGINNNYETPILEVEDDELED